MTDETKESIKRWMACGNFTSSMYRFRRTSMIIQEIYEFRSASFRNSKHPRCG
jgi:hypothetical protein